MIGYTLTWHREAEEELAELWLFDADRNAITAAVCAIDLALANDAAAKGEAVAEGLPFLDSTAVLGLICGAGG